jgi:hypothetical protein
VNGLVTRRLALLLMGGWKAMFYEPDPAGNIDDFDGPIGRAEVTWYFKDGDKVTAGQGQVGISSWTVGYQRDVSPSGLANYYQLDRVYTDVSYAIGGVLVLTFRGGVGFVHHPVVRDRAGQLLSDPNGIDEFRPNASLFAEYRLMSTVALISNTAFSASPSDNFVSAPDPTNTVPRDNLKYFRFTSFIGVRWFM